MVVDDDDAVREAIADVLALDGYKVMAAGDGDEALRLLARRRAHASRSSIS